MTLENDLREKFGQILRVDRIRNKIIITKMEQQGSIIDYVQYGQIEWFDHAKRMGAERLPKRVLHWFALIENTYVDFKSFQ